MESLTVQALIAHLSMMPAEAPVIVTYDGDWVSSTLHLDGIELVDANLAAADLQRDYPKPGVLDVVRIRA